jgi:hypothetical protein
MRRIYESVPPLFWMKMRGEYHVSKISAKLPKLREEICDGHR